MSHPLHCECYRCMTKKLNQADKIISQRTRRTDGRVAKLNETIKEKDKKIRLLQKNIRELTKDTNSKIRQLQKMVRELRKEKI